MADETEIAASVLEEGLDFAQMITAEDNIPTDAPPPEVKTDPEPEEKVEPEKKDPEPEKKEDPKPEEEEENPFDTGKKGDPKPEEENDPEKPTSKDDWSRLRESRDKHKSAAAEKESILREKETEIASLKEKAARTAELEEKLKAFDEQEKELALARVESTLEWKKNIAEPLDAVGKEISALVVSNEGDETAVEKMILEKDLAKQRSLFKEVTNGWDEVDRMDLKKMVDDARILLDRKDDMRSNAHAASKEQQEIATKREAEQKEASKKEFVKVTEDVVKSLREKVPFVALAEGETEDDRYSVLAQKVADVDFDALPPKAKALAAASTFALTHAIKTIGVKDTEIASLKEALAKATKDKPSVVTKTEAEDPGSEDKDFFDAVGVPQPRTMFGPA